MSDDGSISDDSEFQWPVDEGTLYDDSGRTCDNVPLDLCTACSLGKYDVVRSLLRSFPHQLNKPNEGGWTPLMYATYIGHENVVRLLAEEGNIDVNCRNSLGQSSLMLAAGCGTETAAVILRAARANIEARDNSGWTPLFHATYNGHQNMVKFLCEERANIDAVEPTLRRTPLMLASVEGHEIIVQYLLSAGADWRLKDKQEDTAMALALGKGFMKIASLIDGYGRYAPRVNGQGESPRGSPLTGIGDGVKAITNKFNDARLTQAPPPASLPPVQAVREDGEEAWATSVRGVLDHLKLSKLLGLFEEQDIDLPVLLTMTDNDLREIGVKLMGPRRKITNTIARLHSAAVHSKADPVERAYADTLEVGMQEMAVKLHKAYMELEQAGEYMKQERELRAATEKLLVEKKATLEVAVVDCALNRNYCHSVFHALSAIDQAAGQLRQAASVAGLRQSHDTIIQSVSKATQTIAVILKNIEKPLHRGDGDVS